jgi:hypothetical protein
MATIYVPRSAGSTLILTVVVVVTNPTPATVNAIGRDGLVTATGRDGKVTATARDGLLIGQGR